MEQGARKNARTAFRWLASFSGAIALVIVQIMTRSPMSVKDWILFVFIALSMSYGLFEMIAFLHELSRKVKHLTEWQNGIKTIFPQGFTEYRESTDKRIKEIEKVTKPETTG